MKCDVLKSANSFWRQDDLNFAWGFTVLSSFIANIRKEIVNIHTNIAVIPHRFCDKKCQARAMKAKKGLGFWNHAVTYNTCT